MLIRRMKPGDAEAFYRAFLAQGWHPNLETYEAYYREQESGRRRVFVAECEGRPVGYVTLLPAAHGGPFEALGYPELVDFNVLAAYQRRGIGSRILDAAERAAGRYGDRVGLAVGLHSGYGAAQRLYVKRGYVPDGTGAWYRGEILAPYARCENDDDLVLYLSKRLERRLESGGF